MSINSAGSSILCPSNACESEEMSGLAIHISSQGSKKFLPEICAPALPPKWSCLTAKEAVRSLGNTEAGWM